MSPGTPLAEVFDFFSTHPLVRGHQVEYSPVTATGTPFVDEYYGLDHDQQTYVYRAFVDAARRGTPVISDNVARIMFKALKRVALRSRKSFNGVVPPNGCCVPLLKKMHVMVKGDIYLCEQLPHLNSLGNVNKGALDVERAVKMVREYVAHSVSECSVCWALRLCAACYQHFMKNCSWDASRRQSECEGQRAHLLRGLCQYATIVERYPMAFNDWRNVKFEAAV
jgi:uncharacterized protein